MNNWHKLHSASILLLFTSKVKDLLIPLLLTLFAGGTSYGSRFSSLLFPVLIIVILLYSILYWASFRYQFDEGELRIKQGIFIKKNRYIRKNRVQSVDIVTGMFHRLLKVEKVKIETAGGGMEPEVELAAVKQREAQFIRAQLKSVEVPNQSEGEEVQELGRSTQRSFYYKVPLKSIIITGLTSGKVGLVFSAAAALISQIDQFLPRGFYENSIGVLISKGAVFLTGLLLVVAFIAWIISIFITVIQYGNFEIAKNDKELIISRGLLEKRHLTLQLNRITSVRYVCNPLRQWLGVWSIYVDSAGGGSKEEQLSTLLLPLGSRKEIDHLMKEVLPYAKMPETIQPLPKKAAFRYIIRTSIVWWLLAFPVMSFLPNGWVFFVLPLSFSYLGWLRYKDSGYTLCRNQCVLQTRLFSLSCNILPKNQIQSITYQQTFFQKKRKLYTLSADILSTTGGRTFQLKDMEADEDQHIFEWYRRNNI
ncbi:PH domain-containing protein [Alteribacillus sp. YIM 98480]|uniref:PH domain-containing protein n=1 Tax=Alteribacillus sp. YIM 98480 TaxID=2606599 RepID=UPI00131DFC65|nr:PH domain-containing protein [Alteribacillus sp. YIM 98480]